LKHLPKRHQAIRRQSLFSLVFQEISRPGKTTIPSPSVKILVSLHQLGHKIVQGPVTRKATLLIHKMRELKDKQSLAPKHYRIHFDETGVPVAE
jgi:hypothetical protein